MESLFEKHDRIIEITPLEIIRQWAKSINWNARLLAIRGPKGVGKSTMMLQYIKQHYEYMDRQVLYVSCDDSYFSNHTILDLAKQFYLLGGKHLFIDEIHKYDNWSQEIKEIYDFYPTLQVTISGSSLLHLTEGDADLSRRCINHDIQGLSFREFLHFYKKIEMPVYPLSEVLTNPSPLIKQMNSLGRPVALFHEYLKYGYYPYYKENMIDYYQAIQQVVNYIIENELTKVCKVEISNTRKIKALMTMLCASEPYEVDITRMSAQSGLKRETILNYLNFMDKAKLIQLLYCDKVNVKRLQKPDKIYIDNPNMLYAWATTPVKIGNVRETFVVNQLTAKHNVEYSKTQGDFLVDRKFTIEVGGEDKDFRQIKGVSDSYVLADNIETAFGHKLPIWTIGFLY